MTGGSSLPPLSRGMRFGHDGISGDLHPSAVPVQVVEVRGDLLEREVDFIVNPWNRNYLPRWLTPWSSGVSGALKKRTGAEPWKVLRSHGALDVGEGVITDAGTMREGLHLLHVAGLNTWWSANDSTVAASVRNVVLAVADLGGGSVAVPLIGSGTGGMTVGRSLTVTREALAMFGTDTYAQHRRPVRVEIVHPELPSGESRADEEVSP